MTEAEHEEEKRRNHLASLGQEAHARFRTCPEYTRLVRGDEDTYKPFYRGISLVLVPGFGVAPGSNREDTEAILRATHPYFLGALERDRDEFNRLYDMFIDLYSEEEDPREARPLEV